MYIYQGLVVTSVYKNLIKWWKIYLGEEIYGEKHFKKFAEIHLIRLAEIYLLLLPIPL